MFEIAAGRRALVTGGASGFGFAVAERLMAAGAAVAIADLDRGAVESAAARLAGAIPIVMDVVDKAAVRAGTARAAEALGGLDTLINSAGVFEFRPFEEISEREWDWILDVNVKGVFLTRQAVMPLLRASRRGRIANVSSDAGKKDPAKVPERYYTDVGRTKPDVIGGSVKVEE